MGCSQFTVQKQKRVWELLRRSTKERRGKRETCRAVGEMGGETGQRGGMKTKKRKQAG